MTVAIPTLQTERLVLEPPSTAGVEPYLSFYAGERSRFVGGPMTRELAWRAYASEIGHWALRGFGRWSVRDRSTGAYCGQVGCWEPEGWPEPEIGWSLFDGSEGRGIAYEAARAARAYAYGTLGWGTAISFIDPSNERSKALARRLGARPDGAHTHERYGLMEIWRHPSPSELARDAA